jgi:hypothetical protein
MHCLATRPARSYYERTLGVADVIVIVNRHMKQRKKDKKERDKSSQPLVARKPAEEEEELSD